MVQPAEGILDRSLNARRARFILKFYPFSAHLRLSKLSLQDITDEAKAEAASFKAEANKAFVCAYLVFRVVRVWVVMTSFDLILDTRYVCEPCICGFVRGLWSARECSTRLQQGGGPVYAGDREEPARRDAVVQPRVYAYKARGAWVRSQRCQCVLCRYPSSMHGR